MKKLIFLYPALLFILACQKEISGDDTEQPSENRLVRMQQGTDPNLINDTVFLLTYNAANKIEKIIDSVDHDTLSASYHTSGRLETMRDTYGTEAHFVYDESGLLTEVYWDQAGIQKYVFTYKNKVIDKKSHYTSADVNETPALYRYFTYTVEGGNITTIKEYTPSDILWSETKLTYGSLLNPFKELSLFNYRNFLGTEDVINYETYFNQNILTGMTINTTSALSIYTFNAQQQPIKIETQDDFNGGLFTRILSYK